MQRKTALLICDLQNKTVSNLFCKKGILKNVNKLLYMKEFIPQITYCAMSEFIPSKLGKTIPEINTKNIDLIYTKTKYSMINETIVKELAEREITDIILTGMETQWCINRTMIDLRQMHYKVHVPIDSVGNKLSRVGNQYNFENLRNYGALLTTTDALISKYLINHDDIASQEYLKILKNFPASTDV